MAIVTKILMGLLTEALIKKFIILALEELAKKTDNKIDDKAVEIIKEGLK